MNPICPNCYKLGKPGKVNDTAVLLVTKEMSINIDDPKFTLLRAGGFKIGATATVKGRAKYWYCTRCERRWKKGGEIIEKKI